VPVEDESVQNAKQDLSSAKRRAQSAAKSRRRTQVDGEVALAIGRSRETGVKRNGFSSACIRCADEADEPAIVRSFLSV